jgi:hypothetical protein
VKNDISYYWDDKIKRDEMGVQGSTHLEVRFALKIYRIILSEEKKCITLM